MVRVRVGDERGVYRFPGVNREAAGRTLEPPASYRNKFRQHISPSNDL